MVTAPSFLSSLYYYIITIITILLLFNITIIIDGQDFKAGGICKGQEEKMMKWLTKIRNNLKRMTKEDTTENRPQYQENYEFKHAAHPSGRKKMLR